MSHIDYENPVLASDLMKQAEDANPNKVDFEKVLKNIDPDNRYKICQECEHFRSSLRQCKKCGCFLPVKVRISWSECPVGKW